MKIAAFIPARGGSKRLPGKNTMNFCGHPLLGWSISFALKSKSFSGVYVSTNDDSIAEVARTYGAEVIQRPENLSTDHSTTAEAAHHAFEVISKKGTIDWLCTLQPTNPLRPAHLMKPFLEMMPKIETEASIMTVTESLYKHGKRSIEGVFSPVGYEFGQRSQDMSKLYYENGLAYMTPASLMKNGILFGEKVYSIVTGKMCDLDIDDMSDFRFGEFLYKENESEFSYLW